MGSKVIQKSSYKGVEKILVNGKHEYWRSQYKTRGHNWTKISDTEREAAVAFDIKMIEIGENPVNILVSKEKGAC